MIGGTPTQGRNAGTVPVLLRLRSVREKRDGHADWGFRSLQHQGTTLRFVFDGGDRTLGRGRIHRKWRSTTASNTPEHVVRIRREDRDTDAVHSYLASQGYSTRKLSLLSGHRIISAIVCRFPPQVVFFSFKRDQATQSLTQPDITKGARGLATSTIPNPEEPSLPSQSSMQIYANRHGEDDKNCHAISIVAYGVTNYRSLKANAHSTCRQCRVSHNTLMLCVQGCCRRSRRFSSGENSWEMDARIFPDKMKLQKKNPRKATLFPPAATTTGRQRQRDSLRQCSEGRRKVSPTGG